MSDNKLIKAIKDKGQTMEAEMSFFDHLEALRWHLVRAAIAIVIFTAGSFYFYDFIFDTVIMAPSKPTLLDIPDAVQTGRLPASRRLLYH
jgi:sec-independent protein translocase protein TatC